MSTETAVGKIVGKIRSLVEGAGKKSRAWWTKAFDKQAGRTKIERRKCLMCGEPCDPGEINCLICTSNRATLQARARMEEKARIREAAADRQKRREEMIRLEKQKEKMRKEWKERRRIEELERQAETERAEKELAKRRQQQAKKDAIVARKRAEAAKKICSNCGGKRNRLRPNSGQKTAMKYVNEEGWFECPKCRDVICTGNDDLGCAIHKRDPDTYEDYLVCADCCDTSICGNCCSYCHCTRDACDCTNPLSIRDHLQRDY